MKKKVDEYPYSLKIVFTPQIKSKILSDLLLSNNIKQSRENIHSDRKFTNNFFDIDKTKQTDLKITTLQKNGLVEYFTIDMSQTTEIKVVKKVFSFLENFQELHVEIIDQELESVLYLEKNADEYIDRYSKISCKYDDFYMNEFDVPKRDILLKKTSHNTK